ncbi:uncharacterized protein LOC135469748 [Liolophura sinensis]|uniref:uncharacterized protein LOC135469748 n=1 Tax=Liolophura sinensis TaxID=3198878 RepID=UPI003158BFCF
MFSVPVSFVGYRRTPRRYAPRRTTSYKVTTHRTPGVTYHHSGLLPHHDFDFDPYMGDTMGLWNQHMHVSNIEPEKTEWTERIVCTGFSPEEVSLNVTEDKIQITCVHKEGSEDDQDIREKRRTIAIPDDVNPDEITANMTDAGILILTAPFLQEEEEEQTKDSSVSRPEEKTQGMSIKREAAENVKSEQSKKVEDITNGDSTDGTREIRVSTTVKKEQKSDPRKPFQLEVDMRDYKPESIEVKLNDNSLTVIGNQENKDSFTGRITTKSLTRNFFVPRDVDSDKMSSKLNSEGKLIITAPFKDDSDKTIPIKKH